MIAIFFMRVRRARRLSAADVTGWQPDLDDVSTHSTSQTRLGTFGGSDLDRESGGQSDWLEEVCGNEVTRSVGADDAVVRGILH